MRTIIATAGTSVLRGLEREGISLEDDHGLAKITKSKIQEWGSDTDRLSAELSTLAGLEAEEEDRLVLLATDTDDGEKAAKIVAHIVELRFGIQSEVVRIEGLVLDDANTFKREGLVRLVEGLDEILEQTRREGREPVLGICGGIKSVTPYVVIYGMMRRVSLAYMFEFTNRLLTMPRLPLSFDWEVIRATSRVLAKIRDRGAVEQYHIRNELGDYYHDVKGLFEEVEGLVTLSAFGEMLLRDVEQASNTTVSLSPSAQKTLDDSVGPMREQLKLILSRLPHRLWREQMSNHFPNTDLDVWKLPKSVRRAAGWVKPHVVYVAELYTNYEEYNRALPKQSLEDYDEDRFTPWTPSEEIDPLTDAEEATDRLQARNETLEEERDEARARANKYKSALEDKKKQLEASRERNEQMRSELEIAQEKARELEDEQQL
jgi:putative CRISPR-associated protein (TIGR02619 family)